VRVLTASRASRSPPAALRALCERSRRRGPVRTRDRSIGAPATHRLLDSGRNFLFAPIAIWLSWRLHLARAIGDWRRTHGARIATWLAAIGEIEALDSLAAYAFERPDDPFPEITPDAEPLFVAEGLAHPLLPADACVRNDVHLGDSVRVLIVSGSNMSGKSTLLARDRRERGARARGGARLRARAPLSVLSIGASIRVGDSLLEGSSRFQAEIDRLKRIVDLATAGPTLFPARRDPARDQLARSPYRRGGSRAHAPRARRHRTRDHATTSR
jgi:hypothetical protein